MRQAYDYWQDQPGSFSVKRRFELHATHVPRVVTHPEGRAATAATAGSPVHKRTMDENANHCVPEHFDTHDVPASIIAGGVAYVKIEKEIA